MIRLLCPACGCIIEAAEGKRSTQCRFCLAKIQQPDSLKLPDSADVHSRYSELIGDIRHNYDVALNNEWEITKPIVKEPEEAPDAASVVDIYEFLKRDSHLLTSGLRERARGIGDEGVIDAFFMWMMLETDALIESGFYIEQRMRTSVFRMLGGTASRVTRLCEMEERLSALIVQASREGEEHTPFLDMANSGEAPAASRYQACWNEKKAELDEMVLLAQSDRDRFPMRGHCYITTAALEATRQEDGGEVLTAFRDFRDGYLSNVPGGANQIELYYRTAPEIVNSISRSGSPDSIYSEIWEKYLKPCYDSLLMGNQQSCYEKYTEMVLELKSLYKTC